MLGEPLFGVGRGIGLGLVVGPWVGHAGWPGSDLLPQGVPPLADGKVNREGTPLFMSAPEAPLASEFPHITTLAQIEHALEVGATACGQAGQDDSHARMQ